MLPGRKSPDNPRVRYCPACGAEKMFRWNAVIQCGECGRNWYILNTSSKKEKQKKAR